MATDSTVRARIDEQTKQKAQSVLAEMGLTVSDAIRLMLVRIASEKALPFDVKVPNAQTRAALDEAEALQRGARSTAAFSSIDDLMTDLNAPDDSGR